MEMAVQAVEWGAENEYALTTAGIQFAFLHQFRDEPESCRFWAEATIRLAETQGFPFRATQAEMLAGWCDGVEGDPVAAIEEIASGLARYRETGARMDEPYFLGLLADIELRAGRPAEALAWLDEAATVIAATTRSFFYEPELHRLRALALMAGNDEAARGEADDLLEEAAGAAEAQHSPVLAMRAAVTRVESGIGDPVEARRRMEELIPRLSAHPGLPDVQRAMAALGADPAR